MSARMLSIDMSTTLQSGGGPTGGRGAAEGGAVDARLASAPRAMGSADADETGELSFEHAVAGRTVRKPAATRGEARPIAPEMLRPAPSAQVFRARSAAGYDSTPIWRVSRSAKYS